MFCSILRWFFHFFLFVFVCFYFLGGGGEGRGVLVRVGGRECSVFKGKEERSI